MSEKKSNSQRTRNYACVVYPDSAPENWKEIIAESKIPVIISPLHDSDLNPDNVPKKVHAHVMAMYEGVKTREQVETFFKSFGGVGVEVVNSVRGMARYFCHLDNPEKHQYDINQVTCYGGVDYMHLIGTSADKAKAIREMLTYIEEDDVTCFADLLLYASINRSDWFDALINNSAYVIKEYIKSRTWKLHHTEEK